MNKNRRKVILWFLFFLCLTLGTADIIHIHTKHRFIEETGKRLMAIAVTAANDFDPKDLDQLHFARDMKTEAYQRVFKRLNIIRNNNAEVAYAYIKRPTPTPKIFEFIAEADANYNLPAYTKFSLFDLAPLTDLDENIWPGFLYDSSLSPVFSKALRQPSYGVIIDQWGNAITGCAPIFDNGKTNAILCVDFNDLK
jgi:hypothetical protein